MCDRVCQFSAIVSLGKKNMACVNKRGSNHIMAEHIETLAKTFGAKPVGRIPCDKAVTTAQINARALVEDSNGRAAKAVNKTWSNVCLMMR